MSTIRFLLVAACAAALTACNPAANTPAGSDGTQTAATVNCESPAQAIAIGASVSGDIPAGQTYPGNARYYCVNVPEGTSSITMDLTGMSTDLDLYVGHGTLESVQGVNLEQGETYEWKSNAINNVDERVTITNPQAGVYYAEIVSYQGAASNFNFAVR
jgi:hypothetical protein